MGALVKKWYTSKTMWLGIVTFTGGVSNAVGEYLAEGLTIEGLVLVILPMLFVFLRGITDQGLAK